MWHTVDRRMWLQSHGSTGAEDFTLRILKLMRGFAHVHPTRDQSYNSLLTKDTPAHNATTLRVFRVVKLARVLRIARALHLFRGLVGGSAGVLLLFWVQGRDSCLGLSPGKRAIIISGRLKGSPSSPSSAR